MFIEQGVVGLLLLALAFVAYFRKARDELQEKFHWAAFRMAYLVMFLFHNWTETTLLRSAQLLWNLFVLFAVVHPREWTGRVVDQIVPVEEEPAQAQAAHTAECVLDSGMANAL